MKKLGLFLLLLMSLRLEGATIEATDERGVKVRLAHCPQRIASLALGIDETLWTILAPTERPRWKIATAFAKDKSYSNIADVITQHKELQFAESPESLLRHNPDLVIAANYIRPEFIHLLEKKGTPVFVLKEFKDFATIMTQTQTIGHLVCAEKEARAIVQDMKQRLEKLALKKPSKVKTVLNFSREYLLFGQETLFNAIVMAAQADNMGYKIVANGWQTVNPERIASLRPDAIATSSFQETDTQQPGWRQLWQHGKPQVVDIPRRLLLATSHHAVEAAELLHKALYE